MAADHVKGVLDLTFLNIQDESQFGSSIIEKKSSLLSSSSSSPSKLGKPSRKSDTNNQAELLASSFALSTEGEEIKALRLSNNEIVDMSIIVSPIIQNMNPSLIQWLDLSFNHITSVAEIVATSLPNMTTLYLHANKISKLSDIKIIASFTQLKSLTMYGNPVEEKKHYKKYTLHHNPQLTHFDKSVITKQDRQQVKQDYQPD
jgi:Leucine-rich repeat (LRR) protein